MPQIPTAVPNISSLEARYLQQCVESTFVSSVGPFVDRFELELASISGSEKAVVVSSGTVALKVAMEALGIGRDSLVMIPSLTFIATANAVRHTGADVWCVDVDNELLSLDVDLCRNLIENETEFTPEGRLHKKTNKLLKAIVPVMIMGNSVDLERYVDLAEEFDLVVVVDAAAAVGAKSVDHIGLTQTGVDAVCYSFNGNKTITCGGGGAVTAANVSLIEKIKHMTTTGRVGRDYDHDIVAYNYRMTSVQAALGVAQLERLPGFLERKSEIHNLYNQFAETRSLLRGFPEPQYGTNTHWFSGLIYTGSDSNVCNQFREHMIENGVDLRKFWKPITLQEPYKGCLSSHMLVTEAVWEKIFPLPCSTNLTDEEQAIVVALLEQFWSED